MRRSGLRRFAVTAGLFFTCLLLWAAAVPMFAAADENQHMVKAYATVRGDAGHIDGDGILRFSVPAALSGDDVCYAWQPERPASCLGLESDGPRHDTISRASNYPPFYYFLVGWPTLVNERVSGLYLMRAVSALWVALLLALAVENLRHLRPRATLLVGLALAVTPAVMFFGAAVNPSGLSIAAALAVWTGGLVLVRGPEVRRLSSSVALVGAPLYLLLLLRRDSVLWGALIVLVLLAVAQRDRLRTLSRSASTWIWTLATVLIAALQWVLVGAATASSLDDAGDAGNSGEALRDLGFYRDQVFGGVLGWLDTRLPPLVYVVFSVGTGLLAVLALRFAPRRLAVGVGAVMALMIGIPLAIGAVRYGYFQGRYMLPLAVGLPILAALGLAEGVGARRWPRVLPFVVVPAVAVAHVLAFAQTLRRFTAGANGPWWFTAPPAWRPPILSPSALMIAFAVAIVAWLLWVAALASSGYGPTRQVHATPSEPLPRPEPRPSADDEPAAEDVRLRGVASGSALPG
jgi:hypothetical protein